MKSLGWYFEWFLLLSAVCVLIGFAADSFIARTERRPHR